MLVSSNNFVSSEDEAACKPNKPRCRRG